MKTGKVEKLVAKFHDRKKCYCYKHKKFKASVKSWISIEFKQQAQLKSYITMNAKLRKNAKNYFEKYFFKLMNNAVLEKTMENVRKHRNINLVTTESRKDLVIEPNYHTTTNTFPDNLLAIEMKITQILMENLVFLGL